MGKIKVKMDYENKTVNRIDNLVEVKFKHVPFNCKFVFEGQEYKKTNHGRGFYDKEGVRVFRNFQKSKIVKTSDKYFDTIPLTK